jgi:hypothetical protein
MSVASIFWLASQLVTAMASCLGLKSRKCWSNSTNKLVFGQNAPLGLRAFDSSTSPCPTKSSTHSRVSPSGKPVAFATSATSVWESNFLASLLVRTRYSATAMVRGTSLADCLVAVPIEPFSTPKRFSSSRAKAGEPRALCHSGRSGSTNEDFGMFACHGVDDARRRILDLLLKLVHPGLDGLVLQVLVKLVLTGAAAAAVKLKHLVRPAMQNRHQPASEI